MCSTVFSSVIDMWLSMLSDLWGWIKKGSGLYQMVECLLLFIDFILSRVDARRCIRRVFRKHLQIIIYQLEAPKFLRHIVDLLSMCSSVRQHKPQLTRKKIWILFTAILYSIVWISSKYVRFSLTPNHVSSDFHFNEPETSRRDWLFLSWIVTSVWLSKRLLSHISRKMVDYSLSYAI